MFRKFIAPVLIGGAVLGGTLAVAGTASAATPAAASTATAPNDATKGQIKHWLRTHRREIRRAGVEISAKTIGITPQALVADLKAGNSIAGVATQHGVAVQTVENALVTAADGKVDQAVAAGMLSPAEGKVIEAKIPPYVAKGVNRTF
jgi:lambda repressor-like predicted transcriptional regulator